VIDSLKLLTILFDCEQLIKRVKDNQTSASADKAIKKLKRHRKKVERLKTDPRVEPVVQLIDYSIVALEAMKKGDQAKVNEFADKATELVRRWVT
jgi:hypothetical protein